MNNDCFEIFFKKDFDRSIYRAMVEITYRSEKLVRFSIKAGTKVILMEKYLFRKNHQWKISRTSFEMQGNSKINAKLIMDIQDAIDTEYKKIYPNS